jgi:hypothetical protein
MPEMTTSPAEAALTRAIAGEMAALADELCRLACVLAADPNIIASHITDLQAIDLITQTQRALADFLTSEGTVGARLDAICLEALADRLRANWTRILDSGMRFSQTTPRLPHAAAVSSAQACKAATLVMAGSEAGRAARLQAALDLGDALPCLPHLIDITETDTPALDPARLTATGARTDLLVVDRSNTPSPIVQCLGDGLLMGGGAVLAISTVPARIEPAGTILICWDGSLSAIAAVSAAAPLLRRAGKLILSVERDADRLLPTCKAHTLLARIGVEASRLSIAERSAAGSLGRQAADCNAGLIVMGGFGRRQALLPILFGGADTGLADIAVPVFFGH